MRSSLRWWPWLQGWVRRQALGACVAPARRRTLGGYGGGRVLGAIMALSMLAAGTPLLAAQAGAAGSMEAPLHAGTAATIASSAAPQGSAATGASSLPAAATPSSSSAPQGDEGAPGAPEPVALEAKSAARGASALIRRSRGTLPELEHLQARTSLPETLRAAERELPRRTRETYALTADARKQIRESTRLLDVVDVKYRLRQRAVEFEDLQKEVADYLKRVEAAAKRIEDSLADAQRSSEEARGLRLPGAVQLQLQREIQQTKLVRLTVRRDRVSAQRLQAALAEMLDEIGRTLEMAAQDGPSLTRDFTRMGPSLLDTLAQLEGSQRVGSALRAAWARDGETLSTFLGASRRQLASHFLLGLLLCSSLFWLRAKARRRAEERAAAWERSIVLYPLASCVLLTAIATPLVYATYPVVVLVSTWCVASLSSLWLLRHTLQRLRPSPVLILPLLLFVHILRLLVGDLPSVEQLLLVAQGALASVWLTVALRARSGAALSRGLGPKLERFALRFWLIGYAIGTIIAPLGLVHTGSILISGSTVSVFAAVIWGTSLRLFVGTVQIFLHGGSTHTSAPQRARRQLVARRFEQAFGLLFGFLWVRSTLNGFTLWDPTAQAFRDLMQVSAEVGSLTLSVGAAVALLVGTLLAVYLSRAVRSVLEEDVLPLTALGAGTRAATSTAAYYGVLILGMLFAFGAAGVELDKLTVIVGALGVGIGFGLQNLVQNFVAGLILLFGRPVNVEDRIQIGELNGVVKRIGFRASTVRTFQGAEVLVPNADMINTQVINWTLSSPERRLDIDIGVAYGTDPERVIALLVRVAEAHRDVLEEPTPEALFLNHGASSLDFQLRAWTANAQSWPKIASELTVGINRALAAEGIEIPFPQQDLHVRSVDAELLGRLEKK